MSSDDRDEVHHTEPERDEERQGEGRDRVERIERDEAARQQGAGSDREAEHGAARAQALSISASGSAASVASTYQASRGPLSSARKTPCSIVDAANNATESAT